jgi:4-hydroxybenzoate polyprenyl transferase
MKRVTYWPQAFLGLTFNYGVLMGWSAVRGALEWPVLPLYVSCIAWTLIYDTIYGFQDRSDDQKIGVKSTALRFGENTHMWLSGFTSVLTAGLVTTGLMCDQTWPYYVGVSLFTAHLGHQIFTVNLSDPDSCGRKFCSNRNIGLIFWAFILAAASLHRTTGGTKHASSADLPPSSPD